MSDDEDVDSLLENTFSESEEEEDLEMNEKTGRTVRKAAKKSVNYEDPSESDIEESIHDSDEDIKPKKSSTKRTRAPLSADNDSDEDVSPRKTKVVKLKLTTTPRPSRTTRAGSAARSRGGLSVEPGVVSTRRTRARTEEGDEPVELSTSGRHAIRASRSPEPIGRSRATRGSKGVKQPASTIKEEIHETSSYEQQDADIDMPIEIAGTDDQDEGDEAMENQDGAPDDDAIEYAHAEAPVVIDADDDDSDDMPVTRTGRTRNTRANDGEVSAEAPEEEVAVETTEGTRSGRLTRGSKAKQRKSGAEASSDFEPAEEGSEDELSASDHGAKNKEADDYESSPVRRGRGAAANKSKSSSRRRATQASEDELDQDELADELHELKAGNRRRRPRRSPDILYETKGRRERKPVDYSIKPMDQIYAADEDGEDAAPTPSRRARGGRAGASQPWERNLYTTFGPFGGGGGPAPIIGGPWGTGATGGVDSDSSDDDTMQRPSNLGGNVGMTPTSAFPPGLLPGLGQTNNTDNMAANSGTPANLGRVKSQKALADADPLGVDQNVDFSKIGGLEGHIDQLKEMVQMPLLYPELFMKFHVTPPRGVLFHGPPGTGKPFL